MTEQMIPLNDESDQSTMNLLAEQSALLHMVPFLETIDKGSDEGRSETSPRELATEKERRKTEGSLWE